MSDTPEMIKILMHAEWPGGRQSVEFEVEADATEEEIADYAREQFFNICNYGWDRI